MVKLEQILEYLEKHCGLRCAGACERAREIGQVELTGPYTVYSSATLYLKPEEEPVSLWLWNGEGKRSSKVHVRYNSSTSSSVNTQYFSVPFRTIRLLPYSFCKTYVIISNFCLEVK